MPADKVEIADAIEEGVILRTLLNPSSFAGKDGKLTGDLIPIDYAMIGAGYGLKTYTVRTVEELKAALEDAKKQKISTLIDLKVMPKTMTDGYDSWWDVGLAAVSESESVRKYRKEVEEGRQEARKY